MIWEEWLSMITRMGTFDLHRRLEWSLDYLRWGAGRRGEFHHRRVIRMTLAFRDELRRRGAYRFTGQGCA